MNVYTRLLSNACYLSFDSLSFIVMQIKHKLLFSFGIIIFFTLCAGLTSYFLVEKLEDINDIRSQVQQARLLNEKAGQNLQNILLYDVIDEGFMADGESSNTVKLYQNLNQIKELLKSPELVAMTNRHAEMDLLRRRYFGANTGI